MKLKHTPGPWAVTWNGKFYHLSGNDNGRSVKILSVVRDPVVLDETWERQCADAKLIAAAPEMLEYILNASKRIILEIGIHTMEMHGGVINYIDKNIHCSQMPGVKREWENLLKNVKLIEKATGQTIEEVIR